MRRARESSQALVEWALSVFVLVIFALSLIAVGTIVDEYRAVRAAASQAAFAAARAPSAQAAQVEGIRAAQEAMAGSQVRNFTIVIDTGGFARGGTLTTTATGCVDLGEFPIVSQALGPCHQLRWQAHALIEPYRSRSSG